MRFKLLAFFAVMTIATASVSQAQQNSDSANSSAGAEIVSAIAIANTGGLHFGDVVAGGAPGTVVISTAGARSVTGGVTLGNTGAARAAEFTVTGDPAATFDISLPASTVISTGVDAMTVDAFSENGNGVLVAGTETFQVGATLNVLANQAAGTYSGTFAVTVTYN